jgi:predicted ATP-binding protein involved in virulence
MIHFRNVRFQNLLSTGNVWTEIQLDRSPNTLIIGENGAGKSTVLDEYPQTQLQLVYSDCNSWFVYIRSVYAVAHTSAP